MSTHKRENTDLKHLNDYKSFIEDLNDMNDIYKNNDQYNSNEKRKVLIVFDDTIPDKLSNKKPNAIVTESFIRGRKFDIPFVIITLPHFAVPKIFRLNSIHYFIMKIPNKQELEQIAYNRSSDIDFKDFMSLFKKCMTVHTLF